MRRTKPPFRADHVGSLLRPVALHEARAKRASGGIGVAELKSIEDREIERVIREQEEAGLQSITDGEFRRSWWQEGNTLTEDEQWGKLRRIVEVAEEVWGR